MLLGMRLDGFEMGLQCGKLFLRLCFRCCLYCQNSICEMSGEVNMPEITWSSASSKMRSMTISTDGSIED